MENRQKRQLRTSLLVIGVLVAAYVADSLIRGPKAKQKQDSITNELNFIHNPAKASPVRSIAGFKTSNGYAKRILVSSVPAVDIRRFYTDQFEQMVLHRPVELTRPG
jgi:hypothetical protein